MLRQSGRYQRAHDLNSGQYNRNNQSGNNSMRSAMDDPQGYRGGSARMDQDPAEFPTDRNHRDLRNNLDRGYRGSDRRHKGTFKMEINQRKFEKYRFY
jgi:hypothetical protein